MTFVSRRFLFVCLLLIGLGWTMPLHAAQPVPKVYVILWFDTEDYILPASDDAALNVANLLTRMNIKATFKVVGEKARTLEKRQRTDVIDALKKHEIGYHSNYHSVQPTPALYLSNLGWDEGVAEFDRREGPGRDDVQRIFGTAPTCYGQPGSSWGPQSYGAMRKWNMPVYLDAGKHVDLDAKPCYFGGTFTLYKLEQQIRADLKDFKGLDPAKDRFLNAHKKLLDEGGGVVSIVYHPCEFVHRQFWDGANFSKGANPPRDKWQLPEAKTAEETRVAYQIFEEYIRFIKRFPEVEFITASQAARLYQDKAKDKVYDAAALQAIATAVTEDVTFQRHGDTALAPSEVFALLNTYVASNPRKGDKPRQKFPGTPFGTTGTVPALKEPITTEWNQLQRTSVDVADFLSRQGRIPSAVWLGSQPVPPEAYLNTLARVTLLLLEGKQPPDKIEIRPARLETARYVAVDEPKLWGNWVIYPPGFKAPAMMERARGQAWTIKPAVLTPASK
jgi:hypothetical protein